jgi:hypothetical protein
VKRVLLISYSQSGEVANVAESFAVALKSANVAVISEQIKPKADYPYPWRSIRRFFDTMPETVLGLPPDIEPPDFDAAARFDLVIIVYPVWFLSPAPPVQAFLKSRHASVLQGTDVITISVSRAMWQQASEVMKCLLRAAGAAHRDNIVVTHQGSALATLVSTPRALLFGRRDRFLRIFPKAGVSQTDLERITAAGAEAGRWLSEGPVNLDSTAAGLSTPKVRLWLIAPEIVGRRFFRGWAIAIRALGRRSAVLRAVGVYAFPPALIALLLTGLPVAAVGFALSYPFLRRRLHAYAARLAAPSIAPGPGAHADGRHLSAERAS